MRILLLETDHLLAANVVSAFSRQGHSVDWQVDPQEAIISLDVQPADLVITDLVLAGRSGVEFLYELRSYPDWLQLPVIIYTSVPKREMQVSKDGLAQLDVAAYLYKPTTAISQLLEETIQHTPKALA